MANYGQPPAGYGAPPGGVPGYGAPAGGVPGYGAPPGGAPGYGAPPGGVPGYGAPAGGVPGYGAPPGGAPGYGTPPGGAYGAPPAGQFGAPAGGYGGQPAIDPQVQQWFLSVDADRSGHITAHELQQALVNGNWSHFNPETCRLMIGMFDRDMSGTIQLQEFNALWAYINQWKSAFERADQNRTGNIEANELQAALSSMGYNLSPQFFGMVVSRFDLHGRRSLTLDNFIQVCVMIKSNTDLFRQRDTAMAGSIRLNYEDFMTMSVLNKP